MSTYCKAEALLLVYHAHRTAPTIVDTETNGLPMVSPGHTYRSHSHTHKTENSHMSSQLFNLSDKTLPTQIYTLSTGGRCHLSIESGGVQQTLPESLFKYNSF
jgi:hypothetical protein